MIRQAPRNASTFRNTPLVLHTTSAFGTAIPAPLSSFVGREREVRELTALIRRPDARLVTVTGPGGVGKTRLALEVAREAGTHFPDGIAFVDLSMIAGPNLLEPSVARALGMREQADRPLAERVADVLGDRQCLLVFDNFEPFVAASPFVARMLAFCPQMTVLVTSREPLRVSGERVVELPPLSLPDPELRVGGQAESEAVRLFVERATAVRADFEMTHASRPDIEAIARRVDGLPLGIELAAARLAHLPPATLLKRLDRRLRLLTGGARDLPERQRTLRGAIAWSYDLLTPDEQRVFRSQAAFVGGCTLEAAEAIGQDDSDSNILDLLGSLVSKSLLRQNLDLDGNPRFTMLETVREFGLEQLAAHDEDHAVHDRHAAYFLDLVERADPAIWGGPNHAYWLDRLEVDLANFETALRWLEESGDGASLLRMAAALGGLWTFRSHRAEGRFWLTRALQIGGDTVPAARAMALIKLGLLNRARDTENAADLVMQGLEIRKTLGDDRGVGRAMVALGNVLRDKGEYDRAKRSIEEGTRILEQAGDIDGLASPQSFMGMILLEQGDIPQAHAVLKRALESHHKHGYESGAAGTLLSLGHLEAGRGNVAEAANHYIASLRQWIEAGNTDGLVEALVATATLAVGRGQPDAAARLLGGASALAESIVYMALPQSEVRHARTASEAKMALGDEQYSTAWESGRRLTPRDAVTEASELLARIRDRSAEHEGDRVNRCLLTPREETVLRLLVEGHSDREIAEELGISYRSVTSHVRNILAKFNVHSRTAAATHAVRQGLV